jgi:outer membrane protein assembly factor BamB
MGTDFGELLAIRPDGITKWAVSVLYRVSSTPAIMADGRIAFVDEGGHLYVVNPDGSSSWQFDTGASYPDAPAIGRDGTIYTGSDETVFALRPDGSLRWTAAAGRSITGPVAVRPNGVVYVPASYLIALRPNGKLLWRTTDLLRLGGAPAVGADGTIYLNSFDPILYAFNPDGTMKWSYEAGVGGGPDVPSSPAIGRDGTIYVGETLDLGGEADGVMLALNPDGTLNWEAHHGRWPTAPAVGGDGTIYYGSGSAGFGTSSIYAINPDGTLKWQYDDMEGGYVRTPPAIGKGHRVYAGSLDAIFAIGP